MLKCEALGEALDQERAAVTALGDNTASHRNILRASSQYIKRVHDMRWTRGLVHNDAGGDCGFVSPSPSNTTC